MSHPLPEQLSLVMARGEGEEEEELQADEGPEPQVSVTMWLYYSGCCCGSSAVETFLSHATGLN
jgi:hypothetical protein